MPTHTLTRTPAIFLQLCPRKGNQSPNRNTKHITWSIKGPRLILYSQFNPRMCVFWIISIQTVLKTVRIRVGRVMVRLYNYVGKPTEVTALLLSINNFVDKGSTTASGLKTAYILTSRGFLDSRGGIHNIDSKWPAGIHFFMVKSVLFYLYWFKSYTIF